MATNILVTLLALAATSLAQTAAPYVDPKTNINFMGYRTTTGFTFGIALPTAPTTDFIGQIIGPLPDGLGWAGVVLGSQSMAGKMEVVAWPNGQTIMLSPRISTNYQAANTKPYTATKVTLTPIPAGTYVNATCYSATFVCGGCINTDTFKPGTAIDFAYAFSSILNTAVTSLTTVLSDHTKGDGVYGSWTMDVTKAETANYATYAGLTSGGPAPAGPAPAGPATPVSSPAASAPTSSAAPAPSSSAPPAGPIGTSSTASASNPQANSGTVQCSCTCLPYNPLGTTASVQGPAAAKNMDPMTSRSIRSTGTQLSIINGGLTMAASFLGLVLALQVMGAL